MNFPSSWLNIMTDWILSTLPTSNGFQNIVIFGKQTNHPGDSNVTFPKKSQNSQENNLPNP